MRAINFPPDITYFMERTRVSDLTGCWIWQGWIDKRGYGRAKTAGKQWMPHRLAYASLVGPIPKGMTIDHLCFVPACVNPEHLAIATHLENARRQRRALADRCESGHEYTPENTSFGNGKRKRRRCRTCAADRARAYRSRKAQGEVA